MVNMIEFNTGRAPEVVVGKPNPRMLTVLTKAAHLDPARRYQGLFVLLAVVVGAVVAVTSLVLPLVLSCCRCRCRTSIAPLFLPPSVSWWETVWIRTFSSGTVQGCPPCWYSQGCLQSTRCVQWGPRLQVVGDTL
jgi:hypothetical protein